MPLVQWSMAETGRKSDGLRQYSNGDNSTGTMDKDLGKITDAILRSYENCGGINHVDGANLPSKRALASICEDLLQLLFPGFHDQEPIKSVHLARVTAYRVTAIADRLRDEICKSLRL